MSQTVCIDTHILIWALRGEATSGQEGKIIQAKQLLKNIEKEKSTVIIPAIAVGEASIGVPVQRREQFINDICQICRVVPYDKVACSFYASFFGENRQHLQKKDLMEDVHVGYNRRAIHADSMILATALAHNASVLYTDDVQLSKIANNKIQVKGLPAPTPQQGSLLLEIKAAK